MTTHPTIQDFFKQFPDDDACLEFLMLKRHGETLDCPKCGKRGKFHRIRRHPAYECQWCGYEIYPMVGTPFHKSHTPLQKWFYAMYLFTTTRHGVPAKELQRQLGVSYPTAFRMAHVIREYMGMVDGEPPMTGHVEVDETYVGGKRAGKAQGFTGRGAKGKTIVKRIKAGTRISTDEWAPYRILKNLGYEHGVVSHGAEEWVHGPDHVNSLEGYWAMLKRSIRGTHIHVSRLHLPKYLGEFEFRYNLRKTPHLMFGKLIASL